MGPELHHKNNKGVSMSEDMKESLKKSSQQQPLNKTADCNFDTFLSLFELLTFNLGKTK